MQEPMSSIERPSQPSLHDLVSVVRAPASALSGADGQIRRDGAQGLFHADYRVLAQALVRVDGREPEPLGHEPGGPGIARFISLIRWAGDLSVDPTVRLDRTRRVGATGMTEEIRICSTAAAPVTVTVAVDLGCDLAPIETVKSGGRAPHLPAAVTAPAAMAWRREDVTIRVHAAGARLRGGDHPSLTWTVTVPPRRQAELHWSVAVEDERITLVAPTRAVEWARPRVTGDDRRLGRLLEQSLDDLESLRLADAGHPGDAFLAAGVPWFLTLFGRDSIWAARMLLPLGTELAASTLRVLARRQGRTLNQRSGEAPGKIMHELRRHEFQVHAAGDPRLTPVYYGTIDATLLWISLLHDAWRWGMPADQIEPLLDHLRSALGWLDQYADPDGDGFVEYLDPTGMGLANQGWKDSGDAVRFRDGRQAEPPIALAEVQAYAYQAARHGAALLAAFDLPGADRWMEYADDLAKRFRTSFWVQGPLGAHPALALGRDKRPVDALTSNIGHLLGTGILSAAESSRVAELLQSPVLAGGFGLRTMASTDAAFNPLSYHCGSIWAHDTAIAITGLAAEGHTRAASTLVDRLLVAAEAFGYRLPELYSGDSHTRLRRPLAYPAACRPQAWSAASAVAIIGALAGLRPDVPGGRVNLRPLAGAPLGRLSVHGMRVAGKPVSVTIERDGGVSITGTPEHLTVALDGPALLP